MIKIPIKIDSDTKKLAIEHFEETMEALDVERMEFIQEELPRVCHRFKLHQYEWSYALGSYAEALVRSVEFVKNGRFTPEGKVAAGALYYLCDPDDVIPDHDPSNGYIDDANVMNEALKRLKRINKNLVEEIEALVDE